MLSVVRRKLEMAARVRDFSRTHRSESPKYTAVLERLEERLSRADALITQQRAGFIAVHAATTRRRELRHAVHFKLLRHLVRVGEMAAVERPELLDRFRLPSSRSNHKSYMIAVAAMLAEAVAVKDLMVRHGLTESLLEDLARMITQFEEATETGFIGRRGHVGARADLLAVAAEVMELIEWLDGLNRYRFRDTPELQAAWDSARNLRVRYRVTVGKPPAETGAAPPPGGIAPAA